MAENKITKLHPNAKDLSGLRFGRLVVVSVSHSRRVVKYRGTRLYWNCVCDCGNTLKVEAPSLYKGGTLSCGCYQKDRSAEASTTHGMRNTTEFNIWNSMKQRCHNPNSHAFKHYGGRGISVCERWFNSFEEFFHDMGPRPKGLSIDRINNDGNYEPGNCRWATSLEQRHNQRR